MNQIAVRAALAAALFCIASALGVAPVQAAELWTSCAHVGQTQRCPNLVELPTGFPAEIKFRLRLTAPSKHCSRVIYRVHYHVGHSLSAVAATSRALGPGESQTFLISVPDTSIYIGADGVVGGCNHGTLDSWGVIAQTENLVILNGPNSHP